MSTLRVTTVQAKLQWENAGKILNTFSTAEIRKTKQHGCYCASRNVQHRIQHECKKACRKNGRPIHAMDA